ncbi:hypothetical protein P4N68_07020 [Corynebacterium felinum]|uniref:DUF551 domain-containing protein n=1 Tax=Corynebacterium felinum TaxID=131318 RepID=A0ABU2BCP9_9CORY|nr:hypothetical protein [Corynebacterium felinum]MDF5820833.1 hypothetical protein [Corynebacterium felinum]MDR7355159.1 hypothetical protein [Corynebacterium felinum]
MSRWIPLPEGQVWEKKSTGSVEHMECLLRQLCGGVRKQEG